MKNALLHEPETAPTMRWSGNPGWPAVLAALASLAHGLLPSAAAEDAFIYRHNLTEPQYQQAAVDNANAGYRLNRVSGYEHNGQLRFAAIWHEEAGPALEARHNMTSAEYQQEAEALDALGYRITWVDGYNVGSNVRFAAVWRKTAGAPYRVRHDMSSAEYQAEFTANRNDGYRCIHVDGYRRNGSNNYAAIWVNDGGTFPRARHDVGLGDYQASVEQNVADGYRPVLVSAWGAGDSAQFASLWEKVPGDPFWMRHGLSGGQYQAEVENFFHTGYHLKHVCGYTLNGEARFVGLWENPHMGGPDLNMIENRINAYMDDQGIPGLTVAIARNGCLVYARGFGWADLDNAELVSPSSRMRIASISKPITAVAIMRLVETTPLALDDKVFGSLGILDNLYGSTPYNQNLRDICVKHLLWHCSGFTSVIGQDGMGEDITDDPMFNNHPDHDDLIDWMLDNRQPAAAPEALDEYSNFGYSLLGRIIEEVSGQSYETYVRDKVLAPCGISDMELGNQEQDDRLPREVTYYAGSGPYTSIRPRHFDAHGGWIATASDLLRFMVRVDGRFSKPDIISPGTYTDMLTASPANSIRAMGWRFGSDGYGHNGCMSGTIGFLWNTNDGYSFAIVANQRPGDGLDGCAWTARSMMLDIIEDVEKWPDYDLFTGSHDAVVKGGPGGGTDTIITPPSSVPTPPRFPFTGDTTANPPTMASLRLLMEVPEDPFPPPPFQPTIGTVASGRERALHFSMEAAPGWEYFVETSQDFKAWSVEPVTPDASMRLEHTLPPFSSAPRRFIRMRSQPPGAGKSEDPHSYSR